LSHEAQRVAAAPAAGNTEQLDYVRDALRTLPAEQQTALALYYLEGFSVAEIAEITAAPAGTVKSRLYHARNRLRRHLEETHDE